MSPAPISPSLASDPLPPNSPWRRFPLVYEINTWVWLAELSQVHGKRITLADVPDTVIDSWRDLGFDAIWLMGIWERSPRGREIARTLIDLQAEYGRALPGYTAQDVVGSPYAVYRYEVAAAFGGREGLAVLRGRLAARGLRLMLDYVPNHVAVDHPWTLEQPLMFINGTADDLATRPNNYFAAGTSGVILANGRDPYFPPWLDTAQIDAFSPAAREQAITTLIDIASQCDAVRCDMAMLLLNRIFAQTWHVSPPAAEFWDVVTPAVEAVYPHFQFVAEAYWETEAELHDHGFAVVYDKRFYDRLRDSDAADVRDHLLADFDYQRRLLRFIENHDEPRAVVAFGSERSRAAAVLATLLPGMRLLQEGQLDGWRIKLPVQLGRRINETPDSNLRAFYEILLHEAAQAPYHDGVYMALATNPILGHDNGHESLIAFIWTLGTDWRIVVVNDYFQPVKARIYIPNPAWSGPQQWQITDVLTGGVIPIVGNDLLSAGLPVSLKAYGALIITVIAPDQGPNA